VKVDDRVLRRDSRSAGLLVKLIPFWLAYAVTQPMGVTMGSLLSEPRDAGGAGFGVAGASVVVLGAVAGLVSYISIARRAATDQSFLGSPQ
jgi:uncharacterized membrane-anchored protein